MPLQCKPCFSIIVWKNDFLTFCLFSCICHYFPWQLTTHLCCQISNCFCYWKSWTINNSFIQSISMLVLIRFKFTLENCTVAVGGTRWLWNFNLFLELSFVINCFSCRKICFQRNIYFHGVLRWPPAVRYYFLCKRI